MNKVICDMCGTSYAETASQCPICGYARQEDAKVIYDPDSGSDTKFTHVRGGRFSAANVRKINSRKDNSESTYDYDSDEPENTRGGLNLALAITAIVLFVLLVAVLISFGIKIAKNSGKYDQISGTDAAVQQKDSKCKSIQLDQETVELTAEGDMWVIHVTTDPVDTADTVEFRSNAPEIATVDEDGRITAVSAGEATITVSCGKVEKEIVVICTFASSEESWSLNREEFSLLSKGETWDVYATTSTVSKVNITWSSDDESVATVDSGIVTAVGAGSTYIHAEYNGKKLSCKVLCKFEDDTQSDSKQIDIDSLQMSNKKGDVTLVANGESYEKSFELYLVDKNGTRVDVAWTASKDGVVKIDGSKITGIKAGSVTVLKATYEGKTFECTIRVRNK
jgi:uncharacterized protein YjdB